MSGLQPERTRLAWRRTVLTTTAIALLAARLCAQRQAWLSLAAVTGAWLVVLVAARIRIRSLAIRPTGTAGRAASALVLVVWGYALLGAALAAGMRTG